MKMKKAILSCLMLLAGLSASAQEQKGTTEYVFEPHWYVNIQPLGVQYTLGELSMGDLMSYNVQAAVGREFNKVIGGRFAPVQKLVVLITSGSGTTSLLLLTLLSTCQTSSQV